MPRTDASPIDKPRVCLVARRGETKTLTPLLQEMAAQVDLDVWSNQAHSPDAVIATSQEALARLGDTWRGPTAVRLHTTSGPELLIGGPHDVGSREPTRSRVQRIALPSTLVRLPSWDPMPPAVRQRWRTRLGWPAVVIVPAGYGASHVPIAAFSGDRTPFLLALPSDPPARVTALALASAAVVDAADLPTAIALATPTVSLAEIADPKLAAIIDHIPSVDAAISGACGLIDPFVAAARAAALIDYCKQHRVSSLADAVLAGLGIASVSKSPASIAWARIDEIGLPSDSPLGVRVRDAFVGLDDQSLVRENPQAFVAHP